MYSAPWDIDDSTQPEHAAGGPRSAPARASRGRGTAPRPGIAQWGGVRMGIIDVWAQHPTMRFRRHEMFASLRRWIGDSPADEELPVEATVAAMDTGGVDFALISAWYGPEGALISNDEVA